MTTTEETRAPIDVARSALAVIQNRMGVSRLGKSMYREVDADILAMRDAEAGLRALIAEHDVAKRLIRDFTDPDDCWFDHSGGCQAHGYLSLEPGELCPHAEAKRDWIDA